MCARVCVRVYACACIDTGSDETRTDKTAKRPHNSRGVLQHKFHPPKTQHHMLGKKIILKKKYEKNLYD